MELIFNGKQKYSSIVEYANFIGKSNSFLPKGSMLIYGDNFEAMSILLNEYRSKIDLVYIDPPFNTNQIFSISSDRTSTISREKNGDVIAYEDNLDIDEFLNFMYKRLILIYELLSDCGSLYVHIDIKMGHYFKVMLDEIFGEENFKNHISRIKSNPKNFKRSAYGNQTDMILFYTKTSKNIWNDIRVEYDESELKFHFSKKDENGRLYTTVPLHAPGEADINSPSGQLWRNMPPPKGRHWRTNPKNFDIMDANGLIEWSSTGNPRIKKYADEHKGKKIQDVWTYKDPQYPIYPTEKNINMLDIIIKQSSNESSIIMDCFAGSGTTLQAAINNGRQFIGIDNSNTSINVINQRFKNIGFNDYEYIELQHN